MVLSITYINHRFLTGIQLARGTTERIRVKDSFGRRAAAGEDASWGGGGCRFHGEKKSAASARERARRKCVRVCVCVC